MLDVDMPLEPLTVAINVNIGGTKHWPKVDKRVRWNWQVLDIAGHPAFHHDINSGEPLPFDDDEIGNFYSSHTLEHVRHWLVIPLLEDMKRCLVPGGKIRIVVPDIEKCIRLYQKRDRAWFHSRMGVLRKRRGPYGYPETHLGALMEVFYSYVTKGSTRDGHHMAYDKETLLWCIREAGFTDVFMRKYNDYSLVFSGLDFKRYRGNSLYIEGTNG